jgi:hypothetical protein
MGLTNSFEAALLECATQMQLTADPWWIIGSVSMALHGIDPGPIGDIDILVSKKDGLALGRQWKCVNCAGSGAGRFRSEILLKHRVLGMDVEVMAGLEVRHQSGWHPVLPKTHQKIVRQGVALFVPEQAELINIFRLFGRKKDIERANRMREAI